MQSRAFDGRWSVIGGRRRVLGCVFLVLICLVGCKRSETAESPSEPAGAPTTRSTSRTTGARPADSVLIIDGLRTAFPRAVLRRQERGGETFVQLLSQDAAPGQQGDSQNAYSFDMQLDLDGGSLNGAQWRFPVTARERLDSPTGIFLAGGELTLQPFEGSIAFTQSGQNVTMELDGQFLAFPAQDTNPAPGTIRVTGRLEAVVSP